MIKTGECYWRDEEGKLWLAESFKEVKKVDGKEVEVITTTQTLIEE